MEEIQGVIRRILQERFGKDSLIALATVDDGIPSVRTVDAFYADGAFYVLTYALSDKVRHIAKNPVVAICGEWFSGHGKASNLGWFGAEENRGIARKMKSVFSAWIDNGHTDLEDRNTCILRIALTDGVLFSQGTRYNFRVDERGEIII